VAYDSFTKLPVFIMSGFTDFFTVIILAMEFTVTLFLLKIFNIFLQAGYFIFKVTSLRIEILLKTSYFWEKSYYIGIKSP